MKISFVLLILNFFCFTQNTLQAQNKNFTYNYRTQQYRFTWNLQTDQAELKQQWDLPVWAGSILPAFYLQLKDKSKRYVKATVNIEASKFDSTGGKLVLNFDKIGTGEINFTSIKQGIKFNNFIVNWTNEIPAIIDLYYGTRELSEVDKTLVYNEDLPFWPTWKSVSYCIPSAKCSPVQSFIRRQYFGNGTEIQLGMFGDLSTPYTSAFPKPIFSAAMGNQGWGWVAMGTGSIPDGIMSLKVQSTTGCFRYLYREDLWGSPKENKREWKTPFLMNWDSTAFDAYASLFRNLNQSKPVSNLHQRSHWNSWGDFMHKDFDLKAITAKAKDFNAELLIMDMYWETFESSGKPEFDRFPNFYKDIEDIKKEKIDIGFWQSVGWVRDTASLGLTSADLLVGKNGKPRWNNYWHEPFSANSKWYNNYYLLDPSSEKTRSFLKERTQNIIKTTGAKLFKLDFAYALPGPDVATPRNPAYRGEMYPYTLMKIISDAAHEIDSTVTIQYYGISPLMKSVYQLVTLDDMTDAGSDETGAHNQWSVWSALAGMNGYAINASSGYNWHEDKQFLLNTAIIGSAGHVLSRIMPDKSAVPLLYISKRKAMFQWYRRPVGWEPLWLNSYKGDTHYEPKLHCWGRLENFENKKNLTSISLREPFKKLSGYDGVEKLKWTGNWSLISQDNADIFNCKELAVIPYDSGIIEIPYQKIPSKLIAVYSNKKEVLKAFTYSNKIIRIDQSKILNQDDLLGYLIYK